jgi:CRP-like cAMP-binding protein
MEQRDVARLAACMIFKGLDPRDLERSLTGLPHSTRSFESGTVVLLAGCRYAALHVLLEGKAFAEMTSDEGKVVTVESFEAGEALASGILFTPGQVLPVSVETKTPCRFAILPRETLLSLCMQHRSVLEAVLGETGARINSLTEKLKAAQFAGLREKLADWLLRRMELSGSQVIRLEATRERMAELFGVARPSLSRELGFLQRAGIVHLEGRTIRILDEQALRRLKNRR